MRDEKHASFQGGYNRDGKVHKSYTEPFSHPPRAGKQVHWFYHRSPSLVGFDGAFGEDCVDFRVQARVRTMGVNIFTVLNAVMMDLFAVN